MMKNVLILGDSYSTFEGWSNIDIEGNRCYMCIASTAGATYQQPKQTNGAMSDSWRAIEPFVNRLRKEFPKVEVVLYDERFTSVLAHRTMLESGIGRMARRDKALVDRISATIILQDYMQSLELRGM